MADDDYRRLAAACCAKIDKTPKACRTCAALFVPKKAAQSFCKRRCREQSLNKPTGPVPCAHCGSVFLQPDPRRIYCGRKCNLLAWRAANPTRLQELRSREAARRAERVGPTLCAYTAKHCATCGAAWGARRRDWEQCAACVKRQQVESYVPAVARAGNEAKHRAAGVVTKCPLCDAAFCWLYGSHGRRIGGACPPCQETVNRLARRANKLRRKAMERAAKVETVLPHLVFARDGWRCKLCGIETPKAKRGTYEHDAPELDHIVPLAQGGAHTYANTQCACRSCNQLKSDRTPDQMWAELLAA